MVIVWRLGNVQCAVTKMDMEERLENNGNIRENLASSQPVSQIHPSFNPKFPVHQHQDAKLTRYLICISKHILLNSLSIQFKSLLLYSFVTILHLLRVFV